MATTMANHRYSAEAIDFTFTSSHTTRSVPDSTCSLIEAAFPDEILAIACLHCSGSSSEEQYHRSIETAIADMLFARFPDISSPDAVAVIEAFLAVVTVANAFRRCRASTTSIRIDVEPRQRDQPLEDAIRESFEESGGLVQRPASKASVARLVEAMDAEMEVDDDEEFGECAICMDEIETHRSALRMKCKHVFHQACLLQWLGHNHVCPLCRHDMDIS